MIELIKTIKIKPWSIGSIAFMLIVCNFSQCGRDADPLLYLQKRVILAKEDDDRQVVLSQLEKYYLDMPIPTKIKQSVQAEVTNLLHQFKTVESEGTESDTNVYKLEFKLKDVLRVALISQLNKNDDLYKQKIRSAKILAEKIDRKTENKYWIPWVMEVSSFDTTRARTWLLAERAEALCFKFHNNDSAYKDAIKYGALSLQYLQEVADERLRLDVMQRLQVITYKFQSMFELSFALAKNEIAKSKTIKYHLRTIGLTYNYANALKLAGQNQLAHQIFESMIDSAKKLTAVRYMDEYINMGLLGLIHIYWQRGQYDKALLICKEMDYDSLDESQRIEIHLEQGIIHERLGNFNIAESEYRKSLNLARKKPDVLNQIVAYNNLGVMYFNLSEYEYASIYYDSAMILLNEKARKTVEKRCKVLINIAEVNAAQKDRRSFDRIVSEVNNLIDILHIPNTRAELLRSIGRSYLIWQDYNKAGKYFNRAVNEYEQYGMVRASLETKIDVVKCYLMQSKFQETRKLLENILNEAIKFDDALRIIDAIGLKAELERKEGNIDKAIQISNQLRTKIDELCKQLSIDDIDNLTFFLQRSYSYLKKAAVYEIERHQNDSAFVKLDNAKARVLKKRHCYLAKETTEDEYFDTPLDINLLKSKLGDRELVINYLLTEDTIYAFVVNQKELKLLKKSIDIKNLNKNTTDYLNCIYNSIDLFGKSDYDSDKLISHYNTQAKLSRALYQELFGLPGMQEKLHQAEITYIIPDDILYGIPFSCLMNPDEPDTCFMVQKTAIVNLPAAFFIVENQHGFSSDIENSKVLFSIDSRYDKKKEFTNSIKKNFTSTEELCIYKPDSIKRATLSKLGGSYEIYIFLGHSSADTKIPDLSYFNMPVKCLADSSNLIAELSLADLKTIDWSEARMVLLIGCETGVGKLYKGSGLAGIQQSILTLGAEQVLASLWEIDSEESIPLINYFLEYWIETKNSAVALQRAQQKMIEQYKHDLYFKRPHPYFWGAFTLTQTKWIN